MVDRTPLTERSANVQAQQPAPEEWAMVEALLKKPALRSPSAFDGLATTKDTEQILAAARPCNELSASASGIVGPPDAVSSGEVSTNFIDAGYRLDPRTNGIPPCAANKSHKVPNIMRYAPVARPLQGIISNYNGPSIRTKRNFEIISSDKTQVEYDTDSVDFEISDNCDQIRRKINRFIDNGGMKPGEFIKELGINSKTYYTFMKYSGPFKGSNSKIYPAAFRFFQKRESQGLPMPKKQKLSAGPASASGSLAGTASSTASAAPSMVLDGEMEDNVAVYENCDEVRRKINAHMRKPGVTPADFLRQLDLQTHAHKTSKTKLQGVQLTRFRTMKGPYAGNTHIVYYSAYVYFEKERLAEGKPKSKHRMDMESLYEGVGGIDVKHKDSGYRFFLKGER